MSFFYTAYVLVVAFFATTGFATTEQAATKPPITVVTGPDWDVSGQATQFGEYPLSAQQIPSASSPLPGGTYKAVAADHNVLSKIIPGSVPIWRTREVDSEGEARQFRKTVPLGNDRIQKITLQVNCDDVARVYINQRLVSADERNGTLKDGYDRWFLFRSVSGFTYNRIYTYDVTDYFFTNVTNTIFVEAVNLAFDGSHAYFSANLVIEFAPTPDPPRPTAAKTPAKTKAATPPKTNNPASAATPAPAAPKPTAPEKTFFEVGSDPAFEKLHVGTILELGHLYFKADDYRPDSTSYRTLDALATYLKRHPSLKIEVGGHTNLRPGDRFANELSTKRAYAVMRYLTDNGVATNRVTHKGYGKSQPRVQAISKAADRANQRVEVKVLEK
jgi:outer membrane protein OmpA-like peptidoglycan-associated protein